MHRSQHLLNPVPERLREGTWESPLDPRELRSVALPACALVGQATSYEGRTPVGCTLAEVERDLILDTLKYCAGNRTHTANILAISIRTLRNKLHQYAATGLLIPPPRLHQPEREDAQRGSSAESAAPSES
jgi:transcriptional regulator of acetoin/glycerol metabolism